MSTKIKKQNVLLLILFLSLTISIFLLWIQKPAQEQEPIKTIQDERSQDFDLEENEGQKEVEVFDDQNDNEIVDPTLNQFSDLDKLPVEFVDEGFNSQFATTIDKSKMDYYDKSFAYKLAAVLNPKVQEIEELKLKIKLLNEEGEVIVVDYIEPVLNGQVDRFRIGDPILLNALIFEERVLKDRIDKAVISIHYLKEASSSYTAKDKPKSLEWGIVQPNGVELEVTVRTSEWSNILKSAYHKVCLDFKNIGELPIGDFKIEIQWIDKEGEIIGLDSFYPNSVGSARMNSNDHRIYQGTFKVDDKLKEEIKDWKIQVINLQVKNEI